MSCLLRPPLNAQHLMREGTSPSPTRGRIGRRPVCPAPTGIFIVRMFFYSSSYNIVHSRAEKVKPWAINKIYHRL